jgi:hypothetical protein
MEQSLIIAPQTEETTVPEKAYIQELSHLAQPGHFGFRIGGALPGPSLVVSGFSPLAGTVFQRLLLLPGLSRLVGQLFLIQIDRIKDDAELEQIDGFLPAGTIIDAQMFLPFLDPSQMTPDMCVREGDQAYWSILRLCAHHGMISGRGVPALRDNDAEPFVWRSRRG